MMFFRLEVSDAAEGDRCIRPIRVRTPLRGILSLSCYLTLEAVVVFLFMPMLFSAVQDQAMNYMRVYASGDFHDNFMDIESLSSKTAEDDSRPIRSTSR
jgi:hypothetical protein